MNDFHLTWIQQTPLRVGRSRRPGRVASVITLGYPCCVVTINKLWILVRHQTLDETRFTSRSVHIMCKFSCLVKLCDVYTWPKTSTGGWPETINFDVLRVLPGGAVIHDKSLGSVARSLPRPRPSSAVVVNLALNTVSTRFATIRLAWIFLSCAWTSRSRTLASWIWRC